MKKSLFSTAVLLLATHQVNAQDEAWLLQDELTPGSLSDSGAILTASDSMAWPDGRAVFVTYWLGAGDAAFRCAEIRDGEANVPSCWRRERVVNFESNSATPVVLSVSTRRRAPFQGYSHQPPLIPYPHIWVGVDR